jgi:Flp pilus assembly pilin Flp
LILLTLRRFLANKSGATVVEYAVIIVSLSLVIVASISMVGNEIEDLLSNPGRELQNTLRSSPDE